MPGWDPSPTRLFRGIGRAAVRWLACTMSGVRRAFTRPAGAGHLRPGFQGDLRPCTSVRGIRSSSRRHGTWRATSSMPLGGIRRWAGLRSGLRSLNVDGQVAQSYKLLAEMLPQLADWQAAGKVTGVAVDGDQPETVELGGYKITAAAARGAAARRLRAGRRARLRQPADRRPRLRQPALPPQSSLSRRCCRPPESPQGQGRCQPIRGRSH